MIKFGGFEHARNLLDRHVYPILFEQSGYLAHVKRVWAVLIELLEHFFDVIFGLHLGCCLVIVFMGAGLEAF